MGPAELTLRTASTHCPSRRTTWPLGAIASIESRSFSLCDRARCGRAQVQESTWQAFLADRRVDGTEPKQVAEALGMAVAAVYLAKSRVMARLQTSRSRRLEGE